jgi:hypothetical protein
MAACDEDCTMKPIAMKSKFGIRRARVARRAAARWRLIRRENYLARVFLGLLAVLLFGVFLVAAIKNRGMPAHHQGDEVSASRR